MTDVQMMTIDAADRVAEIEDRMAELEAEAVDVEAGSDEDRELSEEYKELEHARDELEARFEAWGGSAFTIKKLGYADEGHIDDLVRSDMLRDREEDPRAKLSAFKLRTIQVGVVETPPECPEDPSHPSFPPALGEWLYERIDHFNRFGETSLEDFSLSRRLDDGSEPSS